MSNQPFSVESGMCLNFIAFCNCARTFFTSKTRKPGPGAFAVGRGGCKSEVFLMVRSICGDTFCSETPLGLPCVWWQCFC